MIKEHEELIYYINVFIPKQFSPVGKYTVKYLQDEFIAIEIHLLNWVFSNNEQDLFQKQLLEKFQYIIKEIVIIDNNSLYILYLKPLEEIRSNKINKLQNKITNGN